MNRRQSFAVITGLLFIAAFSRLIPHAPNFTSIGAVALLGGAWFRNKAWAVLIPLAALYLSDIFLNNVIYSYDNSFVWSYDGMAFVYGAFVLISLLGALGLNSKATTKNSLRFGGFAVLSTVVFFLLSNYGAWLANPMYTQDMAGLMNAYYLALPFALNTLGGTLVFGFAMMFVKEAVTKQTSATIA